MMANKRILQYLKVAIDQVMMLQVKMVSRQQLLMPAGGPHPEEQNGQIWYDTHV